MARSCLLAWFGWEISQGNARSVLQGQVLSPVFHRQPCGQHCSSSGEMSFRRARCVSHRSQANLSHQDYYIPLIPAFCWGLYLSSFTHLNCWDFLPPHGRWEVKARVGRRLCFSTDPHASTVAVLLQTVTSEHATLMLFGILWLK